MGALIVFKMARNRQANKKRLIAPFKAGDLRVDRGFSHETLHRNVVVRCWTIFSLSLFPGVNDISSNIDTFRLPGPTLLNDASFLGLNSHSLPSSYACKLVATPRNSAIFYLLADGIMSTVGSKLMTLFVFAVNFDIFTEM